MRFSQRYSPASTPTLRADIYSAAVDMCEWAESRGALAAVLSQHHAAVDGYLPSPIPFAAAVAARTTTLSITIGALLVLHYEPVKLAEDLAVLDLISRGRVSSIVGLGYRELEMAMFGVDKRTRGRLVEERILQLKALWAGEEVEIDGRRARVTPEPFTPGGPQLMAGGGSVAAAKRAARLGMVLLSESSDPAVGEAYAAEAERCGIAPAGIMQPNADEASTVFIAEDVDKAWDELGSYLLQDALSYSEWNADREGIFSISRAQTVDELREEHASFQIYSPAEAGELMANHRILNLQPLCGGIPPEIAWRYLETAASVN